MVRNKFILRNVVATAICLAGTTMFLGCNKLSNKHDNKEKTLIEKENELLKKENELLKKEQELNQKIVQQTANLQQSENAATESLDFLTKVNGKYPYEVKLLDNPILKKRLKKMLGSQYDFMKSIWQVQIPMIIEDTFFYSWAMQAHTGGDISAALMADIKNNVLYVIIRNDELEKFYSENGSILPKRLQDLADKN